MKKIKKCFNCKTEIESRNKYCYSCLIKKAKIKQKEIYQKKLEKLKNKERERRIKIKTKAKRKTLKQLRNKLWRITSKIVRLQSDHCYTCNKLLFEFADRHAGHFWTSGGHAGTRYDYDNLRVQCAGCNNWKSGNLAEYSVKLKEEIGNERFDALNLKAHLNKKWNREELTQMITKRKEEYQLMSKEF